MTGFGCHNFSTKDCGKGIRLGISVSEEEIFNRGSVHFIPNSKFNVIVQSLSLTFNIFNELKSKCTSLIVFDPGA